MAWKIEFDAAALKALKRLDHQDRQAILHFIDTRVRSASDPHAFGKALTGDKRGLWRYRVGDYRIICQIQEQAVLILVLNIGHRREIYR